MNPKIIAFAIEAHQKTNHLYDGHPYSVHLAMVVSYAYKYISCIPDSVHDLVISSCWLHDTIEDCRLTYNGIKEVAGQEVAEIVYAVSNEKGKNRSERANEKYYEGIRQTPWAKYVKLCDRIANIKYSKDINSNMLEVYKKEHAHFIKSIFDAEFAKKHYEPLINEMNLLLSSD